MVMVMALKARTRKGCYACEFFRLQQQQLGLAEEDLVPRFPYVPPKHRLPRSYNKVNANDPTRFTDLLRRRIIISKVKI